MKVITLITRRPELTRAQFKDYYETKHAPLGSQHFPFEKYVRNHLTASTPAEVGFDCLMECWIDRNKALASLEGPLGDLFAEDEAKFMVNRGVGIDVTEHLLSGQPRPVDPRGVAKAALFLTNVSGLSPTAFKDRVAEWGRKLATANSRYIRVTLDEVSPGQEAVGFPADAILTVWFAGDSKGTIGEAPPPELGVRASLSLDSQETTPAELAANFGR